jgi:hypothetical protein
MIPSPLDCLRSVRQRLYFPSHLMQGVPVASLRHAAASTYPGHVLPLIQDMPTLHVTQASSPAAVDATREII